MRGAVEDMDGGLATSTAQAVAVAAGDEVTRRRVGAALAWEGFKVASSASVEELVESAAVARIELAVLAHDLSLLKPSSALRLLRAELAEVPVVIVSPATGRQAVRKALRAGVSGYVYEVDVETALSATARAVLAGQVCVPDDVRHQLDKPAFSFREKQVLELAARGLTNGEIAQRLFLSESTVKSHLSSSFRKLDVRSRAEAAAIVLDPEHRMELGLFVVPGDGRSPDTAERR
ncbi:MAG: hypothetical protein QOG35_2160 [Solirubrobacteraceae bacterium]|nr:hypothetical protein [Solirubrobacteraceae bacterium]